MKNKILLSAAFAILVLSTSMSAQSIAFYEGAKEIAMSKDSAAYIALFTGKYVEGKIYLHWNVECQQEDGVYIVFHSLDGNHYEVLGYKQGTGVPSMSPIAYYMQDDTPCKGTIVYKLIHISKSKTYLMSDGVTVICPNEYLSNIK